MASTYTVKASVAKPGNPTYRCGPISKILSNSKPTVWPCIPNRLSLAIATQSFPRMAMIAAPLYAIILFKIKNFDMNKPEKAHTSCES